MGALHSPHSPRGPRGPGGGGALLLLLLASLLSHHRVLAARQEGSCRFPSRWEGQWFQSGVRQGITIQHNRLSNKGRCVASDGEKYLVVDEKGSCYRCVVIHEKHANVLQYKETFCQGHTSLDQLCKLITGDALLFSMFRLGGSPVSCPFRGPLAFTYNRGHGDCRSPMSSVEACTQESRLLLRYQACPDVYGTESTVEELQCLATWKEGSARYLVGKVHHSHATSNEDRFRCFVYEQVAHGNALPAGLEEEAAGGGLRGHDPGVVFRVAQSGDATCNGLSSDMEGSRTMTLYKAEAAAPPRCKFPSWLTAHQHWHTLDYRRSYSLHQKNTSLKISNSTAGSDLDDVDVNLSVVLGGSLGSGRPQVPPPGPGVDMLDPVVAAATGPDLQDNDEMRVTCTEAKLETGDTAHIVAHFTMGCQSGFLCLQFYRRDSHVVEIQTGAQTRRQEDACLPVNFDRSSLPYLTLVTSSPEPRQCPYLGKFSVQGLERGEQRRPRSARPARPARQRYRRPQRALQEYNPEDDDGGLGEEDEEEDEPQYGAPARDVRRRPAGIDDPQDEARLFNKKKKQQEERDARIRADLAARQEWEEEAKKQPQPQSEPPGAPAHRRALHALHAQHAQHHQVKSHSKRSSGRSSGHKAVIEVAAAAASPEDEEDDEEDEEEEEEDEEVEVEDDEEMDGAIPDASDLLRVDKPPVTLMGEGRYRPHTPEYGNIDDLLEPSKSSTHWGTYPSDERLLELDSKSSSAGSASKSGRGRRVRGAARGAVHGAARGRHSKRVRRGFGYEGAPEPCEGQTGAVQLFMGCSAQDTMEFRRDCGLVGPAGTPEPDIVSAYLCHGRWEENGTHFLIASPLPRSSRGVRRYCFVYREAHAGLRGARPGSAQGQHQGLLAGLLPPQGVLLFASSGDSCQRGLASPITFNITSAGECVDTSRASPARSSLKCLHWIVTSLVILLATESR